MACRQADAQLVHYSTDYVFDGAKGSPYVETDQTHPLGAYAVSKLAGELYAQAYLTDPLVIRTSGVFGPGGMFTPRANFVEIMLRMAKASHPIRVVQDHVASPTYAPAMASRTADMVERNIRGLFHLGGGEPVSWYAYAKLIFELAGLSPALKPADEREYRTAARRPNFPRFQTASWKLPVSRPCRRSATRCAIIWRRARMLLHIVLRSVIAVARLHFIIGVIGLDFYMAK